MEKGGDPISSWGASGPHEWLLPENERPFRETWKSTNKGLERTECGRNLRASVTNVSKKWGTPILTTYKNLATQLTVPVFTHACTHPCSPLCCFSLHSTFEACLMDFRLV